MAGAVGAQCSVAALHLTSTPRHCPTNTIHPRNALEAGFPPKTRGWGAQTKLRRQQSNGIRQFSCGTKPMGSQPFYACRSAAHPSFALPPKSKASPFIYPGFLRKSLVVKETTETDIH